LILLQYAKFVQVRLGEKIGLYIAESETRREKWENRLVWTGFRGKNAKNWCFSQNFKILHKIHVFQGMNNVRTLKVFVKAPPDKGKANADVIQLFSRELGVSRQNLEIATGHTSSSKILQISGVENEDVLNAKLIAYT